MIKEIRETLQYVFQGSYCLTYPPGFHYGFNVRYQADFNTDAGNHLVDTFVKHCGGCLRRAASTSMAFLKKHLLRGGADPKNGSMLIQKSKK